MSLDLVLTGGRVICPATGVDRITDVGFANGRVVGVGADLSGTITRDVTGLIVVPGLIDMHTHVYWGGTSLGIDAEAFCRSSGVTTAVDTGSAGPGNFAGFRAHVIEPSPVRIIAFLHVSHAGIFGFSNRVSVGESEDIRLMDPVTAAEVADANRDVIAGIKVRLGRHASGDQGMTPFEFALQVAEAVDMPMMVHIDEPPPSYDDVVAALRPGDILTHCYRPFPNTPIGQGMKVKDVVRAARDRGVLFDVGHGMGSFAFSTARAALADGFPPDTISSDIHKLCINGPAFDQVTTLSKFLCLGMDLDDVIAASTCRAADALNRPDLGRFAPGAVGDATLLKLEEGAFEYTDAQNEVLIGDKRLSSAAVVLGGAIWHET